MVVIGPAPERFADKIPPIIDLDTRGYYAYFLVQALHHGHDIFAFEQLADMNG